MNIYSIDNQYVKKLIRESTPDSKMKTNRKSTILRFVFFFALLPTLLINKALAYDFHHITVEMGLNNSTTFSIIKDQKDLMWFSTKEGIDRYDGSNFKNYVLYKPTEITKYGLRRNKFYKDSDNKIWVYNFYEIFVYNRIKDRYEKIYSIKGNNVIQDVFIDNKKTLIFFATAKGLICYDYGKKQSFTYPEINFPISGFAVYSKDLLLLAHHNAVNFLDIHTRKLKTNLLSKELINQISTLYNISGVCVDKDKNIYLASLGQISAFKHYDQQLRTNPKLNQEIDKTLITKIIVTDDNNILFGTPGKSLFRIDSHLNLIKSYYIEQANNENINTNEISDIYIDSNNRIWISGNGISYLNKEELDFQYYKNNTHSTNTLFHNEIRSFVEDEEGNLWIGTNYGISILKSDRKNWIFLNPQNNKSKILNNKILALTKTVSGHIVAGTSQGELFKIDQKLSISPISKGINVGYFSINALLVDHDLLWYGQGGSDLRSKDMKTGIVRSYPVSDVLCIIKSKEGQIVTGGHAGLHFLSNNKDVQTFDASKYNIGSIFCVVEDDNQFLWLASEGQGLIKFDVTNRLFKKYTTVNGLNSNLVYGIVPDLYGNLWLSTTKGISCFNIEKQEFRNYTMDDGLPIKEFIYGAYGKTRNNEIVFGSNDGFIIFNPKDLLNLDLKTNLIMTDFEIFNKSVEIEAKDSPLKQSIDETQSIKLAYNQNSFSLSFSSVNLVNKANYYRWKLEGLEDEWSPIGKENQANYTNIKPGKYRFIVQWSNSNSQLQIEKNTRQIDIEITPPFWKTTYAYFIYFILIALLVYWIINSYLTKQSENQARERIRFFTNILHDIRTPLSLIKVPLKMAIKKKDFSSETLDFLNKANNNASQLTKLIDQLLDFDKKDLEMYKLKLSYINAEETLDQICENFIPLMEQRGILFSKGHHETETILPVDLDKFNKIVFNIISNAIKYTGEGKTIHLSTEITGRKFLISIIDTGIGIPEEQQKLIFKKYFRAKNVANSNETGFGIGLSIAKELVNLHGGEIWFESVVNHGTTFYLRFPMGDDLHIGKNVEEHHKVLNDEYVVEETKERNNSRSQKILIAEDNESLRNLMVSGLKSEFKVMAVQNGIEGLNVLSKTSIDVVVSDLMMPLMDGTEFCYEVKNNIKTSHIPFILLTALNSNENKAEGYRIGADVYLEKPVDMDLLINCIKSLLRNRSMIKERFLNNDVIPTDELSELDKKFVDQIIQISETQFSNPDYSIEDMEREIGISHTGLYRKFKGLFDETPMEFLQHYRLKKSIELLQSGNYYVNEVAYMVGFSDPKYFSIVFKKYYGKNASDFLKKQ